VTQARPTVVLKFGGELLEGTGALRAAAQLVARSARTARLVVVHGGGREIDAALAQASIRKQQVDGLRITDEATLRIVIAVLAGTINTRMVAAINAAGGTAVGLTGADTGVSPVRRARPHRATNGALVDLGLVGEPVRAGQPRLVATLCEAGFVPVIACIGASRDGQLFNVNADTMAASLAARLGASRLVIAGGTPGVLDAAGRTIASLDGRGIDALVRSGTATAGMIAKLHACRAASRGGVGEVIVTDGRDPRRLRALVSGASPAAGWTRLSAA
jgi:acetylglutamate kinase